MYNIFKLNLERKGCYMNSITTKYFALGALLLFGLTVSASAESTSVLPTSKQVTQKSEKSNNSEKIEIVDEIKIQAATSSEKSNPALKEGKACDFSDLEENKGETIIEIPMAESVPCDKVNCNNLKPATLLKDNYKELPIAKTIQGCD